MRKLITSLLLTVICLNGCALKGSPGNYLYHMEQQQKLDRAVQLLGQGKSSAASDLLAEITTQKRSEGITDEALFRLSLLYLSSDPEQNGAALAQKSLDRLHKEYPSSPWTTQSASLREFIGNSREINRQYRALKSLNLSVTRENKELRLNIEKLKNLDIELEMKKKP